MDITDKKVRNNNVIHLSTLDNRKAMEHQLSHKLKQKYHHLYQDLKAQVLKEALEQTQLFSLNDDDSFEKFMQLGQLVRFKKDETIVDEGHHTNGLYIIIKGVAKVYKENDSKPLCIDEIREKDVIGLVPLLDGGPYTASVKATTDILLFKIDISKAKAFQASVDDHHTFMHLNKSLSERLRNTKDHYTSKMTQIIDTKDKLENVSKSLTLTITSSVAYIITLANVRHLNTFFGLPEATTILLSLIFSILISWVMYQSKYSLKTFGLTFKNSIKALKETLYLSFIACAVIIIIKAILIANWPSYHSVNLFSWNVKENIHLILTYILFVAPIQEFITRCGLQTIFEKIFSSPYLSLKAIIMSNIFFAVSHLTFSKELTVLSFFFGLFLGWVYSKNRLWLSIALLHAIIGVMFFWIVGFPGLVTPTS